MESTHFIHADALGWRIEERTREYRFEQANSASASRWRLGYAGPEDGRIASVCTFLAGDRSAQGRPPLPRQNHLDRSGRGQIVAARECQDLSAPSTHFHEGAEKVSWFVSHPAKHLPSFVRMPEIMVYG